MALAHTEDSLWRNRDAFITGRAETGGLPLQRKWAAERD